MNSLLILVAIFLTYVGCKTFEENGALSSQVPQLLIGLILNGISLIFIMMSFGNVRGLFVYLGLVSLLGMLISLINYRKLG